MGEPLMMDFETHEESEDLAVKLRLETAKRARFFTEAGFEAKLIGDQASNLIRRMPSGNHRNIALMQFEGFAAGDPDNKRAFGGLQKLLVSLQKPTHKKPY